MYNESLFKAASGLGAGLAYKGDVCGALLGGYMMLGLKLGLRRDEIDCKEKLHASYPAVQKYYDWFKEEFGSTKCHEIRDKLSEGLNYDHLEPKQREQALYDELHRRCDKLTGKAAIKTTEMIWDSLEAEKRK